MLLFLEGNLLPNGLYSLAVLFLLQLLANEKLSSLALCCGSTGPRYLGLGVMSSALSFVLSLVLVGLSELPSEELLFRPKARLTRSRKGIV